MTAVFAMTATSDCGDEYVWVLKSRPSREQIKAILKRDLGAEADYISHYDVRACEVEDV